MAPKLAFIWVWLHNECLELVVIANKVGQVHILQNLIDLALMSLYADRRLLS